MFFWDKPRTLCVLNLPFPNCRSREELSVVRPEMEFKAQDDLALWVYWKVRSAEKSVGFFKLKSLNQKRRERRGARCWGPGGIGASLLPKFHGPKHMLLCRQHIGRLRMPKLLCGKQHAEARHHMWFSQEEELGWGTSRGQEQASNRGSCETEWYVRGLWSAVVSLKGHIIQDRTGRVYSRES